MPRFPSFNLTERQRLSSKQEADSALIYSTRKKIHRLNTKIGELSAALTEAEGAGGVLYVDPLSVWASRFCP